MFKIYYKKSKILASLALFSLVFSLLPVTVLAADSVTFLENRVEKIDGKTVKVIWKTDVATRGKIIFGETAQDLHYYIVDNSSKNYHEVELGNLQPETTYHYQVIAYSNYEQSKSFVRDFETDEYNDGIPPQITEAEVAYVSGTTAFVTWQTHEEATSVVEYGQDQNYSSRAYSNSRVEDHDIILKRLTPDRNYFFRIYSVDKDGNKSSYYYGDFRTNSTDAKDKEDLEITKFRPAGLNDSQVSANEVIITFTTNRYAKGKVTISRSGFRSQAQEMDYNLNHQANFSGLSPETEYKITIGMTDILGKKITEYFYISTNSISVSVNDSNSISGGTNVSTASTAYFSDSNYCSSAYVDSKGYYAQYFNLSSDTPGIKSHNMTADGLASGWYDSKYFSFSRIDTDLNYGNRFFPIEDRALSGDPFYFSAYWRAILEVKNETNYTYEIGVDNSGWVYIDGQLVTDLGGYISYQSDSNSVRLSPGFHYLEVFFVERGPGQSKFSYTASPSVIPHPWPVNCNLLPYGSVGSGSSGAGAINPGNTGASNNGNDNSNIIVAGAEFSYYTEATALLKTYDSPDIYAIMNGQRHYISSPASFNEYGFNWLDIRTVTRAELEKYPRARLIKSPEENIIYYLYQRPEGQWLKINITSPTVFVSYPGNYWGNVITVTQLDVDSYPDVKLIKTADSKEIYYLENNSRHLVSPKVFVEKGFNIYEVSEVNNTHMESYLIGEPLK